MRYIIFEDFLKPIDPIYLPDFLKFCDYLKYKWKTERSWGKCTFFKFKGYLHYKIIFCNKVALDV